MMSVFDSVSVPALTFTAPPWPVTFPSRSVMPYSVVAAVELMMREALSALIVSLPEPGPLMITVCVISSAPLVSVMVCGVLKLASNVIVAPGAVHPRTARSEPAPESAVLDTGPHGADAAAADARSLSGRSGAGRGGDRRPGGPLERHRRRGAPV